MNQNKHILITGIQRSGTTFTGEILSLSRKVVYLPEPFNPYYGIEGVDCHFPYVSCNNEKNKYSYLIDDLFSFHARYKRNYSKDNIPKIIAKYFFGTRADIRYFIASVFKKNNVRFLIKDPDASLLSKYIAKEYNCQVLVLIRHPGAVMASFKRLGWEFDFKTFLERKELIKDHFVEFEHLLNKRNKSLATQVGLLWVCIYKALKNYSEKQENWLIIMNEDICLDPVETFKNIFDWCDLDFTDKVRREIVKMTEPGNRIKAKGNQIHDMMRDSRQLVKSWKESVTIEERNILREITEPISCHYYDDNSWKG